MTSKADPIREIQSSLKSLVESTDNWLVRFRKRQFRVRLATSLLTAVLIFTAIAASVLSFLFVLGYLRNFGPPPSQVFPFIALSALFSLVCGIATYFFLKGKQDAELKDLSSLITQMKNADKGGDIPEDALALADRILLLLPNLVRKRTVDSLLFGLMTFLLVGFLTRNPLAALIAALIVWLYFRHETTRIYKQEISKLEEQRRIFEQRKNTIIENL
jgi:uncharacterized membrane protein